MACRDRLRYPRTSTANRISNRRWIKCRQRRSARSRWNRTAQRSASGRSEVLSSAGARQICTSVPVRKDRSIEPHSPAHRWRGCTTRARDPPCVRKTKTSWLLHPTMVGVHMPSCRFDRHFETSPLVNSANWKSSYCATQAAKTHRVELSDLLCCPRRSPLKCEHAGRHKGVRLGRISGFQRPSSGDGAGSDG